MPNPEIPEEEMSRLRELVKRGDLESAEHRRNLLLILQEICADNNARELLKSNDDYIVLWRWWNEDAETDDSIILTKNGLFFYFYDREADEYSGDIELDLAGAADALLEHGVSVEQLMEEFREGKQYLASKKSV